MKYVCHAETMTTSPEIYAILSRIADILEAAPCSRCRWGDEHDVCEPVDVVAAIRQALAPDGESIMKKQTHVKSKPKGKPLPKQTKDYHPYDKAMSVK